MVAKNTREQEHSRAVFIETMDNNDKEPKGDDDLEKLGDYIITGIATIPRNKRN